MTTHDDVLRTEQINLRLRADELERLKRLADHNALSPQAMIRHLLKRASDEYEGAVALLKDARSTAEAARERTAAAIRRPKKR
jgi:hypothetical protein